MRRNIQDQAERRLNIKPQRGGGAPRGQAVCLGQDSGGGQRPGPDLALWDLEGCVEPMGSLVPGYGCSRPMANTGYQSPVSTPEWDKEKAH